LKTDGDRRRPFGGVNGLIAMNSTVDIPVVGGGPTGLRRAVAG
jgi:hypothetical protein